MKNSGLTIEELKARHRKLAILRTLNTAPGCSSNLFVLRGWLSELGLGASTEILRDDIRRLVAAGALELNEAVDAWPVVLTQKGTESARDLTARGLSAPIETRENSSYRLRQVLECSQYVLYLMGDGKSLFDRRRRDTV